LTKYGGNDEKEIAPCGNLFELIVGFTFI